MTAVRFRVERSPIRQFLLGVAGLALILAALDVVWLHWLAGAPEMAEDGTLTSRGLVQRRTDILWATVLLAAGVALLAGAVAGLAVRRPVVEITDEELRLRLGGPLRAGGPLRLTSVPWDQVVAVRSGTADSDAWPKTRVLLVEVADAAALPAHPWGAEWVGPTLQIDADSWQVPPEEVALQAQLQLQRKGRRR